MEVATIRKGNTRFIEWKIQLGEQFAIGRSVGLDFAVFDKDSNGNFSIYSWGRGDSEIPECAKPGRYYN